MVIFVVLFIDYDKGYRYKDPQWTIVEFQENVLRRDIKTAESKIKAVTIFGGNVKEILKNLNKVHKIVYDGPKDYKQKYEMIVGNY